jgi:hypothetical protein
MRIAIEEDVAYDMEEYLAGDRELLALAMEMGGMGQDRLGR